MSENCWCGRSYQRGVCPVHGLMRDPKGSEVTEYNTTVINQAGALTAVSDALTANVVLTSGTWSTTGPKLTLAKGTWLVTFHVTFQRAATTLNRYYARIWDGTTSYASGAATHPSQNPHFVQISLTALVALTDSRTISGEGWAQTGGSTTTMLRLIATGAEYATQITAVKLG